MSIIERGSDNDPLCVLEEAMVYSIAARNRGLSSSRSVFVKGLS